jgi:hypothetical protein
MATAQVKHGVGLLPVGDTLLVMWRDRASFEGWHFQFGEMHALADRMRQPILCVGFILSSSEPPGAALRSGMTADLRRGGAIFRRIVVVPTGSSLWTSIVCSFVRGALVVSGFAGQLSVANSVSSAVQRVKEFAGPQTPAERELRGGATELCYALGVAPFDS